MNVRAIIGFVLIGIGIVIVGYNIALIGYAVGDIKIHNSNQIYQFLILFGIMLGIPFVLCIVPGYYLVKSADIQFYRKVKFGKKSETWIQMGMICKEQGKYGDGLYSFDYALDNMVLDYEDRIKILLEKADMYHLMGDNEAVAQSCKKVLELDQNNQTAREFLERLMT
jgi:hypothetical protein